MFGSIPTVMATAWVKSLQCKSMAFEDVLCPTTKRALLVSSEGCRGAAQMMRDIGLDVSNHPKPAKMKNPKHASGTDVGWASEGCRKRFGRSELGPSALYHALTELPEGHQSRNVVEIIFSTGWGSRPFAGRIERIFKFLNNPRTVARFEEYRGSVQSLSRLVGNKDNTRCLADGNEVMGFHCVGGACCNVTALNGNDEEMKGQSVAVRTFSGSGLAHENTGEGKGRRAMVVCRVIAGRVLEKGGLDPLSDGMAACYSVSLHKGELMVLDSRAVLPCFLIIYKL